MTSARSHFYRLAPLAILLLAALVLYLDHALKPQQTAAQPVDCPDLTAGCTARIDGRAVHIGVQGELRVLRPFQLWVEAHGARRVQASFTMEGMDMGFNLYTLRADKEGVFRSRVTLPVCVSGRRDWVMTLDIDGHRLNVAFVTEL